MRLLSLIVFTAALPDRADATQFRRNAKQFRGCLINGKDVDIARFCVATRAYCDILHQFGRFSGPSIANVKQCLEKVEAAQHDLMRHAPPRQRRALRSLKGLLKAELALESPIHKGSVLHDPSAAIGLLWVRRGLYMWLETFQQQVEALKKRIKLAKKGSQGSGAPAVSLSAQCEVILTAAICRWSDLGNRLLLQPFGGGHW